MAIELNRSNSIFGKKNNANTTNDDKPKANFWLNIGYYVDVEVQNGDDVHTEQRFISLPAGIPLDTQEMLPTNSSNDDFRAMQTARNQLLEDIMAAAEQLEPGQDEILNLTIQVRRIKGEQAPIKPESNPFARSASNPLVG